MAAKRALKARTAHSEFRGSQLKLLRSGYSKVGKQRQCALTIAATGMGKSIIWTLAPDLLPPLVAQNRVPVMLMVVPTSTLVRQFTSDAAKLAHWTHISPHETLSSALTAIRSARLW